MSRDAIFIGMQPGFGAMPGFPLFNLCRPAGDLPAGATVAAGTLQRLGLEVPEVPAQDSEPVGSGFFLAGGVSVSPSGASGLTGGPC